MKPSLFFTAPPQEQARELFERANNSQKITRREVIEMYANNKNWQHAQLHDGSHGWVWRGPVIWAPEAALWAMAPSEQEIEQFIDEYDKGMHQLSPEDKSALDAKLPEFLSKLRKHL